MDGSFYIAIPGGQIVDNDARSAPYVTVPDASKIAIVQGVRQRRRQQRQRQLAVTGTNSVLVIRVSASDSTCDPSRSQLQGSVFGTGSNALTHSMKSQYEDCSNNQLSFAPVTGNGVINGVLEVTLNRDVSNENIFSLTNAMNQAAIDAVGNSLSESPDHVMVSECF